jgi:hypothetical protein
MGSSLRNFFQPPVTVSLLGTNDLLSTLYSNIFNLYYSLNVRGWAILYNKARMMSEADVAMVSLEDHTWQSNSTC